MRTRTGGYHSGADGITFHIRCTPCKRTYATRMSQTASDSSSRKRLASSGPASGVSDMDSLPDEILSCILEKVVADASSSADVINLLLTSRRMCELGTQSQVLRRVSPLALAVRAASLSEGSHRFVHMCALSGNVDACYILGMIKFYCLEDYRLGATLLAKAALASHPQALHSLAVIHFNGSGGSRQDRDLTAGVLLCARAAAAGQVEALRELGHCLQDGYGVQRDVSEGRRMLLEANAREAAQAFAQSVMVPRCVPAGASSAAVTACTAEEVSRAEGGMSAALPLPSADATDAGSLGSGENISSVNEARIGVKGAQAPHVLTRAAAVPSSFARQHVCPAWSSSQGSNDGPDEPRDARVVPHRSPSGSRVDLSLLQNQSSAERTTMQAQGQAVETGRANGMEGDAQGGRDAGAQQLLDHHYQSQQLQGVQRSGEQGVMNISQAPVAGAQEGEYDALNLVRPSVATATAAAGQHRVGHQCCCLPHVTPVRSWWHVAVHKFLVDWHALVPLPEGRSMCGNVLCGRAETRKQEFRCCSVCGEAKYCSRVCQAVDWKASHKVVCPLIAARVQQEQEALARIEMLRQQLQGQQQQPMDTN